MTTNVYMAIEGPIGVGKTTLARLIRDEFDAELLLEVFEENPFLSDFYADRARYAFQTQLFFLLSRYRQQHQVIPEALRRSTLISDYMFAKDRLFARLNLSGEELAMYERLHAALAGQIPTPDLVVYLRAETDTLMERIALRDRSYERDMDRDYISSLRVAYDRFFAEYTQSPVLTIDTDDLNIVRDPADLAYVVGQIRGSLEQGIFQHPLPEMETMVEAAVEPVLIRRRLSDFQRRQKALGREQGLLSDLYFDYICLTEGVGQLGTALKSVWVDQEGLYEQVGNRREAQDRALRGQLPTVRARLADCLACIFQLANQAGVDLEEASVERMKKRRP